MIRVNIPCIAFGCLVKPVAAAFGAQLVLAGACARGGFDRYSTFSSTERPMGRGLMEGPVDGNAIFNATRYRCY